MQIYADSVECGVDQVHLQQDEVTVTKQVQRAHAEECGEPEQGH